MHLIQLLTDTVYSGSLNKIVSLSDSNVKFKARAPIILNIGDALNLADVLPAAIKFFVFFLPNTILAFGLNFVWLFVFSQKLSVCPLYKYNCYIYAHSSVNFCVVCPKKITIIREKKNL